MDKPQTLQEAFDRLGEECAELWRLIRLSLPAWLR